MIVHETPNKTLANGRKVFLVVIHGDAGKTDAGTVSWIRSAASQVSYHYLIGRDGAVYKFVDEASIAWHAGDSKWPGCTVEKPGRKPTVNPTSIGVAFANDGKEPYRPVQYQSGAELVADICRRHGIARDMVVGHFQVSPGRKTDPWPHFDWDEFERLLEAAGSKAA